MRTLSFLLVLLAAPLGAQTDAAALVQRGRALVDAGYRANAPDSLLAARATLGLARAADDPEVAAWAAYYTALADHRLAYVFWGEDAERAAHHAAAGAEVLAPVLDDGARPPLFRAEAHALYATLLGDQIGLDPTRAPRLGEPLATASATARRLAPDNPRVLFQSATALLNTPPEWGGDPAEAVRQLERATGLFVAPADPLAPAWGEDEAYAWLGLAHLMREDAAAARPPIERAAALNPSSPFVQYKLLPWLAQVEAAGDSAP